MATEQKMSRWGLTAMVVGGMVGAGIFSLPRTFANATGPFGACIAHGYLTLALANLFMPQLMQFENLAMGVNYGSDRLRFPAPVKVGSRIRGHGQLVRVEMQGQAVQAVVRMSVEIEGSERPGCVVDTISRYTFNPLEQ